jgi:hypothetical protein
MLVFFRVRILLLENRNNITIGMKNEVLALKTL